MLRRSARSVSNALAKASTPPAPVRKPKSGASNRAAVDKVALQPREDRLRRDPTSYDLASRVKHLTGQGQLDAAYDFVKAASPNAGDAVVVWNTLLHAFLLGPSHARAWDVWVDMKRRGIQPTSRSFTTFFSGYARHARVSVPGRSTSLVNAKTVYAQWLRYADAKVSTTGKGKSSNSLEAPDEDPISCIPTNAYLSYLGNSKEYALLLETFNDMPSTGPLAPDPFTYSIVLGALRPAIKLAPTTPPAAATPGGSPTFNRDLFDAAMAIWKRMEAELDEIETRTATLVISICGEAERPEEQAIGLTVAERFFGFILDPEQAPELETPKGRRGLPPPRSQLDPGAMAAVLTLAVKLHKSKITMRLFNQVRDYPARFGDEVLNHHHCDLALVALGNLKDSAGAEDLIHWMLRPQTHPREFRPTMNTWSTAMQACWRAADLPRAYRLLELMTGRSLAPILAVDVNALDRHSPHPFSTPPPRPDPSTVSKGTAVNLYPIIPDTRIACTLLQTALAERDRSKIAATLRILSSFLPYPKTFFAAVLEAPPPAPRHPAIADFAGALSRKRERDHEAFWRWRLAEAIENSVDRVLRGGDEDIMKGARRAELEEWGREAARYRRESTDGGKEHATNLKEVESMEGRRIAVRRSRGEEVRGSSRSAEREWGGRREEPERRREGGGRRDEPERRWEGRESGERGGGGGRRSAEERSPRRWSDGRDEERPRPPPATNRWQGRGSASARQPRFVSDRESSFPRLDSFQRRHSVDRERRPVDDSPRRDFGMRRGESEGERRDGGRRGSDSGSWERSRGPSRERRY